MALKVGELFASLGLDTSGFTNGLKGAEKDATAAIGNLAKKLGVLKLGKDAFSAFEEFESAFVGVQKTIDETATTTYDDLKNSIIDMSKEIPATTTQIAAVAEAAGQLGISADDVMDFTRTMIEMGESTNLNAEDAATTLARLANIMGTSSKEFSNLGSTIVALGNNFATTEAEIAEMSLRIAAAGAQVGMSESDVMAFSAAFSSMGIEAQAGGSAMSRIISKISVAVANGGKDLKAFADVAGMSSAEFGKAFNDDATAAIMAFIEGLGKAENPIKTLSDMNLDDINIQKVLLGAAGSADDLNRALELANKAYADNNALSEEAAKRHATTESQIQLLKNSFTELLRTFGETMAPIIKDVVEWATKIVNQFSKMGEGTKKAIIGLAAAFVGFNPVVGTFKKLYTNGRFVATMVSKLSGAFKLTNGAMAGSVKSFSALGALLSPTGIVLSGLAATVAYSAIVAKKMHDLDARHFKLNIDTSDLNDYKVDIDDVRTNFNVEAIGEVHTNIENLGEEIIRILNDGLPEGEKEREALSQGVQDAIAAAYDAIEKTFDERKAQLDTLYSNGLIDEQTYNTSLSGLEEQADEMRGNLDTKADALTSYITTLCANNRKMTDAEIDELNALLASLGLTAESVMMANDAQAQIYQMAYDKTRLGFGSDEDRQKAYEWIELQADQKIREIDAEKATLDAFIATLTTGLSDEEAKEIFADYQDEYDALEKAREQAISDKNQEYFAIAPTDLKDMENFLDLWEEYQQYRGMDAGELQAKSELGISQEATDATYAMSIMEDAQKGIREFFNQSPEFTDYLKTLAANGVIDSSDLTNGTKVADDLLRAFGRYGAESGTEMKDEVVIALSELSDDADKIGEKTGNGITDGIALALASLSEIAEDTGYDMAEKIDEGFGSYGGFASWQSMMPGTFTWGDNGGVSGAGTGGGTNVDPINYDRMGDVFASHQTNLYMDGRLVARGNAGNTKSAISGVNKRIALGYGK